MYSTAEGDSGRGGVGGGGLAKLLPKSIVAKRRRRKQEAREEDAAATTAALLLGVKGEDVTALADARTIAHAPARASDVSQLSNRRDSGSYVGFHDTDSLSRDGDGSTGIPDPGYDHDYHHRDYEPSAPDDASTEATSMVSLDGAEHK